MTVLNEEINPISPSYLIEVEQKLLGMALNSPQAIPDLITNVNEEDFLLESHRFLFRSIAALFQEHQAVTTLTITDYLNQHKWLEKIGGLNFVSQINDTYYGDEDLQSLSEIIYIHALGRRLDRSLQQLIKERQLNPNIKSVINKAQTEILKIDLNQKHNNVIDIGQSTDELIEKIEKLEKNPFAITGVTTGFKMLDKITAGFQQGDLVILAARPAMGKTAFALNLAYNAAVAQYLTNKEEKTLINANQIAIFSLEMPKEQLTQRILTMMANVASVKLKTGQNILQDEWNKIRQAQKSLQQMNIFIDDTAGLTIQQLQATLQKLKRDHNITLCIIDYLQLIKTSGNGENRQNEIAAISQQLKRLARDLQLPIICLSQLSRSVERREDRRPMMSDLRDSGAIEQDADIVMFLYRDDYYNKKNSQPDTNENVPKTPIQETELIIAKHRNGSTGTIDLTFNLEFGKFLEMKK